MSLARLGVYSPQIPGLKSVSTTVDTFEFFDNNLTFGTDVKVQLGKRLQVITIKLVYLQKFCFFPKIGLNPALMSTDYNGN